MVDLYLLNGVVIIWKNIHLKKLVHNVVVAVPLKELYVFLLLTVRTLTLNILIISYTRGFFFLYFSQNCWRKCRWNRNRSVYDMMYLMKAKHVFLGKPIYLL